MIHSPFFGKKYDLKLAYHTTHALVNPIGSPPQRAPEGSALWTPAPRRGGVLRGQRQGSTLHPRLRSERQRALPSGLPLGLSPQTPRCCASFLACGRDEGFGAFLLVLLFWPARQKDCGPVGFMPSYFTAIKN